MTTDGREQDRRPPVPSQSSIEEKKRKEKKRKEKKRKEKSLAGREQQFSLTEQKLFVTLCSFLDRNEEEEDLGERRLRSPIEFSVTIVRVEIGGKRWCQANSVVSANVSLGCQRYRGLCSTSLWRDQSSRRIPERPWIPSGRSSGASSSTRRVSRRGEVPTRGIVRIVVETTYRANQRND